MGHSNAQKKRGLPHWKEDVRKLLERQKGVGRKEEGNVPETGCRGLKKAVDQRKSTFRFRTKITRKA